MEREKFEKLMAEKKAKAAANAADDLPEKATDDEPETEQVISQVRGAGTQEAPENFGDQAEAGESADTGSHAEVPEGFTGVVEGDTINPVDGSGLEGSEDEPEAVTE